MRRPSALTSPERWELGLFLAMLMTGLLCIAAVLRMDSVPKLVAFWNARSPAPVPVLEIVNKPVPLLQVVPTATIVDVDTGPVEIEPAFVPKKSIVEYKWYNGQKYKYVRTLRLRVTAYAPDGQCCWPFDGSTTASGLSVRTNSGRLVAADTNLIPMHSLVSVPGYSGSAAVPVLDRGGAIKGHRLDVLLPTFDQAKQWGARLLDVKVYEPVK